MVSNSRLEPAVAAHASVSSSSLYLEGWGMRVTLIPDYYVLYSILNQPKKTQNPEITLYPIFWEHFITTLERNRFVTIPKTITSPLDIQHIEGIFQGSIEDMKRFPE